MADAKKAIDFMLHQEDSTLSGVVTGAVDDKGGCTRFGLCAKWHPDLVKCGFFDAMKWPQERALSIAEETYDHDYSTALRIEALSSDAVACAMLSFAVIDGTGTAIALLRNALNTFGYKLAVDAAPEDAATFAAETEVPDTQLVPALVQHQRARFERIVANDPSQAKWLKGWENRAEQVLALVGK